MNQFTDSDTENIKEKMQRIAIADSLAPSRLSLCLIALLEIYFLVTWLIYKHNFTDYKELRYFVCYSVLLLFSVTAFILSYVFEKDTEKGYKKLIILQMIFAVVIMMWAVLVTVFDADHHSGFSYMIYATIIVILPAVIYVNHVFLNLLYVFCDAFLIVFTVILKPDNLRSTILNFTVFAIVSLCACNMYKKNKDISIRREIELLHLAEIDHLTGLYNRQRLNEIGKDIFNKNLAAGTSLSCVMADIDDFKKINDKYGHLEGDRFLEYASQIIREEAEQNSGMAFRYGGEEFLVLLSDCSSKEACDAVERMQRRIKEGAMRFEENVSLCFGIYTAVPTESNNIEQYLSKADSLMYESKKKGKNCYTAYYEPAV